MAVAVGLAAGIGMLMIVLIMSVVFNYTFLALWTLNYGYPKYSKIKVRF